MRLRRKPETREALLNSEFPVFKEAADRPASWEGYFGNSNPIRLEVGIGKGRFLYTNASLYPGYNFVGMEFREEMLYIAMNRYGKPLPNSAYIWDRAENLCEYFAEGEIERIYLNFSDPWPRNKHAKRRLTSECFLRIYERVLAAGGELNIKTDNRGLYSYSVSNLRRCGWRIIELSEDLYSDLPADNVATEYEEKFVALGNKIHLIRATR